MEAKNDTCQVQRGGEKEGRRKLNAFKKGSTLLIPKISRAIPFASYWRSVHIDTPLIYLPPPLFGPCTARHQRISLPQKPFVAVGSLGHVMLQVSPGPLKARRPAFFVVICPSPLCITLFNRSRSWQRWQHQQSSRSPLPRVKTWKFCSM